MSHLHYTLTRTHWLTGIRATLHKSCAALNKVSCPRSLFFDRDRSYCRATASTGCVSEEHTSRISQNRNHISKVTDMGYDLTSKPHELPTSGSLQAFLPPLIEMAPSDHQPTPCRTTLLIVPWDGGIEMRIHTTSSQGGAYNTTQHPVLFRTRRESIKSVTSHLVLVGRKGCSLKLTLS